MGKRADRQPYLALIEACLIRFHGVAPAVAREQVARLGRSRRIAVIEHVEAFCVAYDLAHPDEDGTARIRGSNALLAEQRPEYERLMVETGYLPAELLERLGPPPARSRMAG